MNEFVTIEFADNGQDFLEWVIRDNIVIDSQPFQQAFWAGGQVEVNIISDFNAEVFIQLPHNHRPWPIRHRVIDVRETPADYVAGYLDHLAGRWDSARSGDYRAGWNVANDNVKRGIAKYVTERSSWRIWENDDGHEIRQFISPHKPPCTRCDGAGYIEQPNISGHDYETQCSDCNGSGVHGG